MKKNRILVFLLLTILILSACSNGKKEDDFIDYIAPPNNNYLPLEGVWELSALKSTSPDNKEQKPIIDIGDNLYVNNRLFAFGDRFTVFPQYSSKYVNYQMYIEQNFLQDPKLRYDDENVEILRVTDLQNFSQELIKIDDNTLVLSYSSYLYKFTKKEDKVDKKYIEEYTKLYANSKAPLESGEVSDDVSALIGIKVKNDNYTTQQIEYDYFTLLFKKKRGKDGEIYQVEDLLIPREEGFWKLDHEINSYEENTFILYPVNKGRDSEEARVLNDKLGRNITYLSDNYISFKKYNYYSLSDSVNHMYEIRDLDKFSDNKTMTLNDVAGQEGVDEYEKYMEERISFYENNFGTSSDINFTRDISNIGVERDLNQWDFMTTVEIRRDGVVHFNRTSLDLVEINNIIRDEEKTQASKIKGKIPSATQAFTFPNNDYIMIKTDNEIYFCEKIGDNIGKILSSIRLDDDTEIIMAEYALDSYAESWKEQFMENDLIQPIVITY